MPILPAGPEAADAFRLAARARIVVRLQMPNRTAAIPEFSSAANSAAQMPFAGSRAIGALLVASRQDVIDYLGIFDSEPDDSFDGIVQAASAISGCPAGVRAYIGHPVLVAGHCLGTLSVLGTRAHRKRDLARAFVRRPEPPPAARWQRPVSGDQRKGSFQRPQSAVPAALRPQRQDRTAARRTAAARKSSGRARKSRLERVPVARHRQRHRARPERRAAGPVVHASQPTGRRAFANRGHRTRVGDRA